MNRICKSARARRVALRQSATITKGREGGREEEGEREREEKGGEKRSHGDWTSCELYI